MWLLLTEISLVSLMSFERPVTHDTKVELAACDCLWNLRWENFNIEL